MVIEDLIYAVLVLEVCVTLLDCGDVGDDVALVVVLAVGE